MRVHLETYPNTPCGIPMCRAAIVAKDPSHVTCEQCVAAMARLLAKEAA